MVPDSQSQNVNQKSKMKVILEPGDFVSVEDTIGAGELAAETYCSVIRKVDSDHWELESDYGIRDIVHKKHITISGQQPKSIQ
jgi:hypothetical protein